MLLLAIPQLYGVGYPVMDKATAGQYAVWFLIILAFGKIAACGLTIGIGGSGGIFAPSLFIGVTSGYAYGDIVHHLLGPGAGQPALYAVVAMGAVFTSAARAPLTSLASVVEMSGDFSLALPVMLAVAIASTLSRALSYGTIYTTKLLRRGTDIDQAAPWRALADLKVIGIMHPFPVPLPVTADAAQGGPGALAAVLPGPVTGQRDVQAVFASESLDEALRQLEVYGRDGLPVLSADGERIEGWITSASVLQALARQLTSTQARQDQAAARDPHAEQHPSAPLPGYHVAEVTITPDSPAAGRALSDITWPPGTTPVSVLRNGQLGPPGTHTTLGPGDRVSLLIPQPPGTT